MNKVFVNGIKCYAYHGCIPEEAIVGTWFSVDVELTTDFSSAGDSDDLNDTINYADVQNIVIQEMKQRSNLIEHVGYRILKKLKKELQKVKKVKVRVVKFNPPMDGEVENVAIEIEE